MSSINFSNIRAHNGSQASGFEELVCQLANLQKPENALRFTRKEGAGGDAGVECYWVLEDDSEICWQAKYFPDGMNPSRWKQLNKSFEIALERHPNLTKYIICLPLDKTDIRRKGRGGKKVVSVEDEWNTQVQKWKDMAQKKGRSVEFEYWGKHEITSLLTIDDPLYSGRALYWFDEPVLNFGKFEAIADKAQEALGDRYTPEFHVDLPVAKIFDGLCLNGQWWKDLEDRISDINEKAENFFKTFIEGKPQLLETEKVQKISELYSVVYGILSDGLNQKGVLFNVQDVQEHLEKIDEYYAMLSEEYRTNSQERPDRNGKSRIFYDFFIVISGFSYFLRKEKVKAAKIKATLLSGEAGIGKSHLLCDISLRRIKNKQPTIFLLGSQYSGGNPIELIKDAVDLKGHRDSRVLGAIDAAGEASDSRALIVIDAINEGLHREDWQHHLIGFLSDISKFNHIAVLLSCRSTFLTYILPEQINEDRLIQIQHFGFQGHEHRAAEKYLSQQGISKPSTPILAPEFTNPLFLKTCCQALKANNMTAFPKGLRGVTSLFDFYLQSVEKTVAKRKRYNPQEKIIKRALIAFSSKLFPEHLTGIPTGDARKLFEDYDPDANKGDTLLNELLHEGVLSEEISYEPGGGEKPFVRFTYERFSDHFIAQQIIDQYNSENIDSIFAPDQPLGKAVAEQGYYAGILEALTIIIAEKYNKELVDLLPCDSDIDEWLTTEIFSNTVIWRTPSSFSARTLELLNEINVPDRVWNIFFKLSTEPSHPWNARLIHSNLIGKEIAERDHFWSIHVALGYTSEEGEGVESIVRDLIEWSCFGDLEEVEEERIRLCAITLLWFLTTSNRKVRDRATKSLVRMLSKYPSLLPDLLCEFNSVNDLYLVERLYAVAYGVVCNITDQQIIFRIATLVFEFVFKDGKPIPHILLRDYARGILELALHKKLLPDDVNTDLFRPPYNSEWPIENPTQEEIDGIIGDKRYSKIESSVMGYPGDFGRYTMDCVHRWSPTPLSAPAPQTGYDLQKEFAEKFLHGEVQAEYLKQIASSLSKNVSKKIDISSMRLKQVDVIKNMRTFDEIKKENDASEKHKNVRKLKEKRRDEKKRPEELEDQIKAQIGSDENREYYRWLSGLSHSPATFSRKWAQRWVCKRAYEFGWTKELFFEFEKHCSYGRGWGLSGEETERIGKKYQWIAFHELLARLSDNVYWIDRSYSDMEDEHYYGPWQMHERDIDPTIWIRKKNGEHSSFFNEGSTWWQPYEFPFSGLDNIRDQRAFLWDTNTIPNFSDLLQVKEKDPDTRNQWMVLRGFWMEQQSKSGQKKLNCWFRINAVFIFQQDYDRIKKELQNKRLTYPYIISIPSTHHQGYFGEYPWHPVCEFMSGWRDPDDSFGEQIPTKHFVPVSEYKWESGSTDYSLDHSLSFYFPAKELVESLGLRRTDNDFGSWENDDGVIFRDPSIKQYGPSYALMDSQKLDEWLDKNGLDILWLIGGEKQLFPSDMYPRGFYGRLIYSGLFSLVNGMPTGSLWFEREEPRNGSKDIASGKDTAEAGGGG